MPKKSLRKLWTKVETTNLEKYIKSQAALLRDNFYWNIYFGKMKYRRPARFFIEMGSHIGRSPSQCKSKFQKFEREIYVEYLEIPASHFLVYNAIRALPKRSFESDLSDSQAAPRRPRKYRATRRGARNKALLPDDGDERGGAGEVKVDPWNDVKCEDKGENRGNDDGQRGDAPEKDKIDLKKERERILHLIRTKEIKLKNFRKSKQNIFISG